ncbi:hypothetical protein [Candidatus Chloroploca asiatica]|uniref:Uncharacterized protein n=1 Tax=Candidatus Chloroploca asiatica TaxID=1506545 RepID=A0A2H3KKK8_9CHLR|nr:hypothetical protein [Candidatus Chloroploca asiatica]PDV98472.1 hypothetical protein A9Q02_15330 [Candidatus Chloroploca asiatica]
MELLTIRELPMPASAAYQRAVAYLRNAGYRRKWWGNSFVRDQRQFHSAEPSLDQWSVRVEVEVLPQQPGTAVITVIFRVNTRGRTMTDPVRHLWEQEATKLVAAVVAAAPSST